MSFSQDQINLADNLVNLINSADSGDKIRDLLKERLSFLKDPLFTAYLMHYLSEYKQLIVLRFIEDNYNSIV